MAGVGGNPRIELLPTQSPQILATPGSKWAIAQVYDGVQRELRLYSAPLAQAVKPDAPWVPICNVADKVTDWAVFGDHIYLRTHRDSPRSSIVRVDLAAPDMKRAETVVAAGTSVIEGVQAARDALYFVSREGAITQLSRLPWGAKTAIPVRFPVEGAAAVLASRPDRDGVIAAVSAWTRAREIYAVAADGGVTNTGLQPLGPFDAPTDIVATEVTVKSHDGAMIPMSIVHRKDVKLDGSNPAVVYAYGSYGVTFNAGFNPTRLAFLEKGGIVAFANVRGSSAYGEEWYKAGYKSTKPNTWKDVIACGEYLVTQKYSAPSRLSIFGGSAGGIAVGRALTERPDLFSSVVIQVGMLDFVRLHVMPIGPVNVVEFGSAQKEDEFRGLLAMSSYHHVKDGVKYPAVLLQHGVNDARVNVGQSNKMAARLMSATASGKPILLDLEFQSGHGAGSTKQQTQREIANAYAFILWQAGHPEFRPPGGTAAR